MSILDANGSVACADCGRKARDERDQLQAENAKLRNEIDNLLDFEHLTSVAVAYAGCDECGEYKQTMLRLFAENAKLREFINLKETCWKYVGWCDECPYNGMDDEHDECNCTVREKIDSLARELRIGVD